MAAQRIVDLSRTIEPAMPVFPAYPRPNLVPWTRLGVHTFASEALFAITHTGTHMDAPSHFVEGAASIEAVPLSVCHAPGVVLDVREVGAAGAIGAAALRQAEDRAGRRVQRGQAVLLWTDWSRLWGKPDYLTRNPGLTKDGAEYLAERGAAVVGVDSANLDHPKAGAFPAHQTLLGAGIPIVENLCRLGVVRARAFTFVATPLRIAGATGSPVRAIAIMKGQAPGSPPAG